MTQLSKSIETYILAKDHNRPHLIPDAFAADAHLQIASNTADISFPGTTAGADGIADVLVRQFAKQYENVYTFCIGAPPSGNTTFFQCSWLVCMTEKDTGALRAGFGTYQWTADGVSGKISKLVIMIEQMKNPQADLSEPVLNWARSLPYPWCESSELLRQPPASGVVREIIDQLRIDTRG